MQRPGSEGRTILRVAVVGENEQERAAIKAALSAVSDPALEIVEIALAQETKATDDVKADVAMVIFSENGATPLGYLQAQAARSPHPVLFALLPERSPALMRRALHAGAEEMLFLPLDAGAITRAMLKLTEARRKNERSDGGAIYSVMSLAGGVGATTLSANLALALRYILGKRVALVDLDLQNGGLSVYLHLNPEQTIIPLIEFNRNLDSIKLEAALTKHASGIYLLAAPYKIEDCELVSDMTVATVLDLMRRLFDFVVVDCGRHVNENVLAVWEHSDEVLYVTDQTLAVARTVPRFMEFFVRLRLRGVEPRLILNRFETQNPFTVEELIRTAGTPIYAKIPRDDRTFERLQLRPQDLWRVAPASGLARSVENLARKLGTRRELVPEAAGGLMARFLGAIGARA